MFETIQEFEKKTRKSQVFSNENKTPFVALAQKLMVFLHWLYLSWYLSSME
jgi:hypothetical protein